SYAPSGWFNGIAAVGASFGRRDVESGMDATRTTLLALDLFGSPGWSADKEIQRLHALSNHAGRHYRRIILSKRHGGQRLVLA
ncbi:hypothetical protein OFN50_38015, partial [Escherichia coli]|nr:hypothetical protein [Escherichia coli]